VAEQVTDGNIIDSGGRRYGGVPPAFMAR
jgi:hypothetical protein